MKKEGITESFIRDDQRNFSPSMTNLEKVVYSGLAGRNFSTSEIIAYLKYLKECSTVACLDMIKQEIQKGRDFKNFNEYPIEDYLDIVQKIDQGDRNFLALEEYFNLVAYLEQIDDSDYSPEYQMFKKLGTQLFANEEKFYQKIVYTYAEEKNLKAKFLYQPPSISYLPLFVELYKILGGDFKLKTQIESAQKKEFYNLILEKFKKLNALELGCGPGFGLSCLKKVARNVVGIDKQKFSRQPKGIAMLQDDVRKLNENKTLSAKEFNFIYSLDLLEGEVFTQDEVREIIKTAHGHLSSNGLQLHLIPYRQFSEKIVALKNYMLELKKQYPNEFDAKMGFDPNSNVIMSRTLLLEENDITDLARELNATVVKTGISNHHWVLALRK